jgi:methyltransferase (TIGR00027 family)
MSILLFSAGLQTPAVISRAREVGERTSMFTKGKRIESTTSRTAEWTCVSRAVSSLETDQHYRSDDYLAVLLLPTLLRLLIRIPFVRTFFTKVLAPRGIYEYVVARTKYIDAAFRQALLEKFGQILLLGAGFDTRALRFQAETAATRMFELDVPITQNAKIRQYQKRNLTIPPNTVFVAIDFDKESLPVKLDEAGFRKDRRSLFVLEGVTMYLQPKSVQQTFETIRDYAGAKSRVVFDYVRASALRQDNALYGKSGIVKSTSHVAEQWHFGIEREEIAQFLSTYGLKLIDHRDAQDLEDAYFKDTKGRIMGRIDGTHCLVTAVKP